LQRINLTVRKVQCKKDTGRCSIISNGLTYTDALKARCKRMGFLWEIYNSLEGNEVPADGKMIPDGRNGYKRSKAEMKNAQQLARGKQEKEKNI
jgi:hypothetical protein